jgi:hypothetical protein
MRVYAARICLNFNARGQIAVSFERSLMFWKNMCYPDGSKMCADERDGSMDTHRVYSAVGRKRRRKPAN